MVPLDETMTSGRQTGLKRKIMPLALDLENVLLIHYYVTNDPQLQWQHNNHFVFLMMLQAELGSSVGFVNCHLCGSNQLMGQQWAGLSWVARTAVFLSLHVVSPAASPWFLHASSGLPRTWKQKLPAFLKSSACNWHRDVSTTFYPLTRLHRTQGKAIQRYK